MTTNQGTELHYDPDSWPNERTYGTVHRWLLGHWREIQSGAVLDVEYILGEMPIPKVSERLDEVLPY